ncbi:hypothetical protein N431DRAFT_531570 [Stipitochalara longipes BDJ]|nr:hypothetical protein N431DRAFT_531570 [Stipitochalara longipes BDJ]
MGNANTIPIDSYLDRHACSGRNITWHYMNNAGILPAPYNACPYVKEILATNCCSQGDCHPPWPSEMERYEYNDWDGLGNPYDFVGELWDWTKGPKAGGGGRKPCLGRPLALSKAKEHWPPLGLDGRLVENYKFYETVDHNPPYVQVEVGPLMESPVKRDSIRHGVDEGVVGQDEEAKDGTEDNDHLSSDASTLDQTSALRKPLDKMVNPREARKKFIA